MPEGPELYLASRFINAVCADKTFGGKIIKSDMSRQNDIDWNSDAYEISSKSRGKEIMLTLTEIKKECKNTTCPRSISILFHFGMSGVFKLTSVDDIPKHSHLRFFTVGDVPQKVLSFVDVRRFGSWQLSSEWNEERGPDPVSEYKLFRENILSHVNDPAFKKPICEVLLNQRYFNGIGNYLRAEILYRSGIRPFDEARSVLEHLPVHTDSEVKTEGPDILQLCHEVPMEVIRLDVASSYDPSATREDIKPFLDWLQCYDKPEMKSMRDHNKRTIWFSGDPGPLQPTRKSSSGTKRGKKSKKSMKEAASDDQEVKNIATTVPKDSKDEKRSKPVAASRIVTRSRLKKETVLSK